MDIERMKVLEGLVIKLFEAAPLNDDELLVVAFNSLANIAAVTNVESIKLGVAEGNDLHLEYSTESSIHNTETKETVDLEVRIDLYAGPRKEVKQAMAESSQQETLQ